MEGALERRAPQWIDDPTDRVPVLIGASEIPGMRAFGGGMNGVFQRSDQPGDRVPKVS